MANQLNLQEIPKRTLIGILRGWFLAGLLATVPLFITFYVAWFLITLIDGYATSILPDNLNPQQYFSFPVPGIGIIIGILVIILIGFLATNLLGSTLIRLGEGLLGRLPVIGSVYGTTKKVIETVIASRSDAFREAVLIEYPRRGAWAVGFVTGSTKGEIQNISSESLVSVFVPTTPNPTSGFLLFFPREDLITLDMTVEDAVKLVISGGIVAPDDPQANRKAKPLRAVRGKATKKSAVKKKKSAKKKTVKRKAVKKKAPKKKIAKRTVAKKKAVKKKALKKKVAGKKAVGKKVAKKKAMKKKARKKSA